MRIHSDTLTWSDVFEAAQIARVHFAEGTLDKFGSRKRDHAFNIILRGESRRAPNFGTSRGVDRFGHGEKAATWDQWGVFLAILFDKDPRMVTPYDESREAFQSRTDGRFTKIGGGWENYWPADAHGDHTFKFSGVPFVSKCTKCSAVQRYGPALSNSI